MKCQNSKCNFTNPSEAIYCECGYHFEDVVLPTKKCPNTDCDFSSPLAAICCECGYKFVKEALIRKFGKDWYTELEKVAKEYK